VTDADLLLGYLDAGYFLGGRMPLDADGARRGIEALARQAGLAWSAAAAGIVEVVNENMANMIRVHAAERGVDVRAHTMIAFGGSGPVHAYEVARKLGVGRLVLPPGAGVTSSIGLLGAPPAFDLVRSDVRRLEGLDPARVAALLTAMEVEARELLREAGVADADVVLERSGDFRYVGQGYEVRVPLLADGTREHLPGALLGAFETEYRRLYHRLTPGASVEVLNWRLRARGPRPGPAAPPPPAITNGRLEAALKGTRPAYFREAGGFVDCPVYDRYRLAPGHRLAGPAIVEERESTAVLGPRARVEVDGALNLAVTLEA
jgi:N-methylhydantoinase A